MLTIMQPIQESAVSFICKVAFIFSDVRDNPAACICNALLIPAEPEGSEFQSM